MNPIASILALVVGAWAAVRLLGSSEAEPGRSGTRSTPPSRPVRGPAPVRGHAPSAPTHAQSWGDRFPIAVPQPLLGPVRGHAPATPTHEQGWGERFPAPQPPADQLWEVLQELRDQGVDPFSDPQGWASELAVAWSTRSLGIDLEVMGKDNRIVLRATPRDGTSGARMLRLHLPEDPDMDRVVLSGPEGTLKLRGDRDPAQIVAGWLLFEDDVTLADLAFAMSEGAFGVLDEEGQDEDLAIPASDLFTIQLLP